ncbi:hypothetical protein Nepgr_017849 [Nepenthes gracilis]|uniref:Uncharacterized protein n=1 Tax=Nepenthes gracilis TaxID=150966 RepID=A0AAD3SQ60_NEPGR|nr:hypothetical protein Nepgr_017849 [Nepenthes gracilis]
MGWVTDGCGVGDRHWWKLKAASGCRSIVMETGVVGIGLPECCHGNTGCGHWPPPENFGFFQTSGFFQTTLIR